MIGFHTAAPGAALRPRRQSCAGALGEKLAASERTGEGPFESIQYLIVHAGSTTSEVAGQIADKLSSVVPAATAPGLCSGYFARGSSAARNELDAIGGNNLL